MANMRRSRNRHRNFDAQDGQGQSGHFLTNIVKGFAFAVVAFTLAAIGYNMAPQQSKDIVSKVTSTAREVTAQTVNKAKGENGDANSVASNNLVFDNNLDPDKKITVDSVTMGGDGTGTMVYQNHTYNVHLAGISILPGNSEFMKKYSKQANELLKTTLQGKKDKDLTLTVKRPKQDAGPDGNTGIYLFVNGKMLQQTLLENGLAYVTVAKGTDGASSTLYGAQTIAQQQKNNIWQVKDAIVENGEDGYKFDRQSEKDYMATNGKKVKFGTSRSGNSVVSKVINIFK